MTSHDPALWPDPHHLENRQKAPPEELDRYRGRQVAWSWDGTRETEDRIAEETKATIRCIPFDRKEEKGACMVTGKPSEGRVVFAKAY